MPENLLTAVIVLLWLLIGVIILGYIIMTYNFVTLLFFVIVYYGFPSIFILNKNKNKKPKRH